jgi:hypothetical protein
LPCGFSARWIASATRQSAFTPVLRPLFPGYPLPELAWSEMRYTAYSFVMPKFRP